jgi:56kDa selenium binding protein (SBP56)
MSEAPAAHAHQGPGYASPQAAREQPPEKYVDQFYPELRGWLTKLDRQADGTYALDPDFFVDFHEQAEGARPHEIHLPGGDCTTEIFQ